MWGASLVLVCEFALSSEAENKMVMANTLDPKVYFLNMTFP